MTNTTDRPQAEARQKAAGKIGFPDVISSVCELMKIKKLSADQCRHLAQVLGKAVRIDGNQYLPVPREELLRNEGRLRLTTVVTEAVEAIKGAPSPALFLTSCWPEQRAFLAESLEDIIAWAHACREALKPYEGEKV